DRGATPSGEKKAGVAARHNPRGRVGPPRLPGNTGMALNWIDVTAVGVVVAEKERVVLKVTGSDDSFVLKENPVAKPGERTAFVLLREALERGELPASVTGRVEGWKGHFPPFLKTPPPKPRVILVHDFEPAKK